MEKKAEGSDYRERLRELTGKIATENDPDKFTHLVRELNRLLDGDSPEPSGSAPNDNQGGVLNDGEGRAGD